MNRIQKMAWLTVICCGVAVLLSGSSVAILYSFFGFPVASAGLGFLGIIGFSGLGPAIFKKDPGSVSCDERDQLIQLKAIRIAAGLTYAIFIIVCMTIYFYCQLRSVKTISIEVLIMLIWALGVTSYLGHSVVLLILYGKDNKLSEGGAV